LDGQSAIAQGSLAIVIRIARALIAAAAQRDRVLRQRGVLCLVCGLRLAGDRLWGLDRLV
jgi:hypothetical protein